MTNDIIAKIEVLLSDATPEPWEELTDSEYESDTNTYYRTSCGPELIENSSTCSKAEENRANAALIVLLRNNARDLLRLARIGMEKEEFESELLLRLGRDPQESI